MIIGIEDVSTVDYPDHIASVLYTNGCDFRCPYCFNPELVEGEGKDIYNVDDVIKRLQDNKLIDGVVVSGGEPTIWNEALLDLAKRIKLDTKLMVKLDTNGSNFYTLKRLALSGYVDYIALDIKTGTMYMRHLQANPKEIKDFKLSVYFLENMLEDYDRSSVPDVEYRHTCFNPFSTWLLEDFPVLGTNYPFYLQRGRIGGSGRLLNPTWTFNNESLEPLTQPQALELGQKLKKFKYVQNVRYRW